MLAYVPKERYANRRYCYDGIPTHRSCQRDWDLCSERGAVYDLSIDSSRPATPEDVAYFEAGLIPHIDKALMAEEPEALWVAKKEVYGNCRR